MVQWLQSSPTIQMLVTMTFEDLLRNMSDSYHIHVFIYNL